MQAGSRSSRTMAPNRRNPPRDALKHWELDTDRHLDERPPDDRMDVVGGPAFETHECPVRPRDKTERRAGGRRAPRASHAHEGTGGEAVRERLAEFKPLVDAQSRARAA